VLWLGIALSFLLGYNTYWFSGGPDLGARYWYPAILAFAAIAARGVEMTAARLRLNAVPDSAARLAVVVMVATISAAMVVLPWRAVSKHYRYRGIGGDVRELAASQSFGHALVFVKSGPNKRDYASAFVLNPPTLESPGTIYAWDAGPANRAAVVARFADRPVWVIGRLPGADGVNRLAVIDGPLPPGTVPK
jgi:hypothetical protein